ncbi:MAG: hypothetical protein IT567_05855 [Alphaproteobacteria bacterium]|nr:hypothetical protein [Alphaproteobacteria bacterium]
MHKLFMAGLTASAIALTAGMAAASDGESAYNVRRAPTYNAAAGAPMPPVPNAAVAPSGEEGDSSADAGFKSPQRTEDPGLWGGIKSGFSSMGRSAGVVAGKVKGTFSEEEPLPQRRAPAGNMDINAAPAGQAMMAPPPGMAPMPPAPPGEFGDMPMPPQAGSPVTPLAGMDSIPPLPPQPQTTGGEFPDLGSVPPPPPPGMEAMQSRDAMMADREARMAAQMEAEAERMKSAPQAGGAGWETYPRQPMGSAAPSAGGTMDIPPPPQVASVPDDLYTLPSQQVHLRAPSSMPHAMRQLPESRYAARRARERGRHSGAY